MLKRNCCYWQLIVFDFLSHHDCLHYPLLSLRRILNVPVILCHAKCRDNHIKSIRDLKEHAAPCSHNQCKHETGNHAVLYSRSSALVLNERSHNDSPFFTPPIGCHLNSSINPQSMKLDYICFLVSGTYLV